MKTKFKALKIMYILAIFLLVSSFLVIVLEKSQVTNLYTKPVQVQQSEERPVNSIDYSPASPTDNDDINSKKESGELGNANNQQQPNDNVPIGVVLTAATQDEPGGPVVVRVLVSDASSGTCNFTMQNGGDTLSYTAPVINSGTYYSCEPLDIPVSDVYSGSWQLTVEVLSNSRSGQASQSVEVKI